MKKILTSLLILLFSFAFFSCSDPSGGGSSDSVPNTGGTTTGGGSESGSSTGDVPGGSGSEGGEGTGNSGGSSTAPEAAYLRIDADGTPNENGDYILFGEYPQTKVTDEATLSALGDYDPNTWTSYGYYINKNVNDFMKYTDKEYEGAKYRGVYFTEYRPYLCTISASADESFQDDNGYTVNTVYWFKYDPIKWRILKETDGTALIFSEMAIDSQQYDYSENNYAESEIRVWLNDTFTNTAFNSLQQPLIRATLVDNSAASTQFNSNEYACENTNDKVFLLSYKEATNPAYGFSESYDEDDPNRQKKTTDYAQSQGCDISAEIGYEGNCSWWLRSPDIRYSGSVSNINSKGDVTDSDVGTSDAYLTSYGVVPALTISLQ